MIAPDRGPLTRADVLHPEEVAELLGVPRSRVLAWGRDGTLPRRKLGRTVVFLRADVEHVLSASATRDTSR